MLNVCWIDSRQVSMISELSLIRLYSNIHVDCASQKRDLYNVNLKEKYEEKNVMMNSTLNRIILFMHKMNLLIYFPTYLLWTSNLVGHTYTNTHTHTHTHTHTNTHTHTHSGRNLLDVKVSQTVDETSFIPSLQVFRFGILGKVKLCCIVSSKLSPLQMLWFMIYWHANFLLYVHTHALPKHIHTYTHIHACTHTYTYTRTHTHTHTQATHTYQIFHCQC